MRLAIVVLASFLLYCGFSAHSQAATSVRVYVENDSSLLSNADLNAALPAFQTLLDRDLGPAWGVYAQLTTERANTQETVLIQDYSDVLGAEAYHWVTNGRPISHIFIGTSQISNDPWTVAFSHELEEMLIDPQCVSIAHSQGRSYLEEIADPVEAGSYALWIDGLAMSDFILPSWYHGSWPYDQAHQLLMPGQLGVHGYAYHWDGGWIGSFNE